MTEHRPGPWTYYWRMTGDEADCGVTAEVNRGSAYAIARCPRYQTREQWEADARLISAAPDLLEALETIMKYPSISNPIGSQMVGTARAAIAKARGQ